MRVQCTNRMQWISHNYYKGRFQLAQIVGLILTTQFLSFTTLERLVPQYQIFKWMISCVIARFYLAKILSYLQFTLEKHFFPITQSLEECHIIWYIIISYISINNALRVYDDFHFYMICLFSLGQVRKIFSRTTHFSTNTFIVFQ